MRKKSLNALYGSFVARSRSLTSRSIASLPADPAEMAVCTPVHQDGLLFLVVRLQHLWGEFCRELVVRSAIGDCVTRSGLRLPPAPGVNHVRELPIITNRPLPDRSAQWEAPQFAIGQARRLKVANFIQLSLGLGSVTMLEHLRNVRNFIVHPNKDTRPRYYQTARELGYPGMPPAQLLSQRLPGGVTIFDDWISELETAAWNAVA